MFWCVVRAIDQRPCEGFWQFFAVTASRYVANYEAQSKNDLYLSDLSAAKKRFAMSEETDLEATTEESIECVSSSDLEKSKKDEALANDGKVESRSRP